MATSQTAILALSDGTVATGTAIGAIGTTGGELCFNTSMTGYQEIFTDPSYHGQLMMMTYPHIGNYGVSERDNEASRPMVAGVIVRSYSTEYSNTMADGSLHDWLKNHGIVGISGLDTRRLVRHIREKGVMNAVISSEEPDTDKLIQKAKKWPSMAGLELASTISRGQPTHHGPDEGLRIAAFDYGMKQNIINKLVEQGLRVTVYPARTPFSEVEKTEPDGYFFSNGPGDPEPCDYAIAAIRTLLEADMPLFGICLGHQLLGLACGARTQKMKFGHHGANHPVQDLATGAVMISSQNHGFAVDEQSLPVHLEATHRSLFDGSLQGIRHRDRRAFGFQGHPEASPGPHDLAPLFDHFIELMRTRQD